MRPVLPSVFVSMDVAQTIYHFSLFIRKINMVTNINSSIKKLILINKQNI